MRTDHHVPITYWKAWKSREVAIEKGFGNTKDAHKMLLSYLEQLALANPGSVVAIETTRDAGDVQRFKYLFISLAASVKGYSYMRKVIVVDGTHLKGKYVGCLLTASAQDGNYQIFSIAFVVVDGENDSSWTWFFQKILEVVEDGYDLVFVSDRHKSIYAALLKMYPRAKHFACLLHLQRNIVTMFKKKHLAYLVSKAARAYRVSDFYRHFNEIKMIDINCADYLVRVGFEHWTRSHCHGLRYNIMTSNIAESLNAALAEARGYPIVVLLDYIRSMLMRWLSGRREASAGCSGVVTPKVEELMSKNFSVSTGLLVRHINGGEFEVRGMDGHPFRVDLDKKVCSCLEFDILLIPCEHAVAAAMHSKRRIDALVGEKFTRNTWAAAYSMSINPTSDYMTPAAEADTLGALNLAPSNTRRPPGRPKKTRIFSRGEFKSGLRWRRPSTCRRCGGADHNCATCKMPI
ncbi:uncharacterized protein LOC106437424 [Brassica napus]|uniref:uncharacterized protein LOC106301860 n=1 Tax=Brassica oleracea var. oleracea TaxID=109376 RepID=UPI0006A6A2F1|nr:PREDICTED: uncharacterized protein LOC106301860 [Brassica oleracea var. oleracea]XP_013593798.1 PREDICTED: uncharacterized protein LOC106301860 [Brassica oleracea var. oleracea]XP_022562828.1 uncharacterized protein LOC106437424 [Brassica napus]